MSQTHEGGLKAAKANTERYGADYYARIGALGGKRSTTGGYAKKAFCDCGIIEAEHTKPQCSGRLGGRVSRREKRQ